MYQPENGNRRRGSLALLITNINFKYMNPRNGAQRDEDNMKKLLGDKGLGYNVVSYRDLTATDIENKVKAFSQREEHKTADSTVVVIMSRGERGGIFGIHHSIHNKDVFKTDRIFEHLNTANCKALMDKPKVVIIQACRGGKICFI